MRKLLLLLLLLTIPTITKGQSTSVSATIVDSGGVPWVNGTYTFTSAAYPSIAIITGTLDSNGAFTSITFPTNATTASVGSQWTARICPLVTSPCFSKVVVIPAGPTLSLTSSLIPPAITIDALKPPPLTAYADSELVNAVQGSRYLNVTDSTEHVCKAIPCSANWSSALASNGGSMTGVWTAGPTYGISTVSEAGNIVTVVTTVPCPAITGANQSIVVAGVGVSGYNTGPSGLIGFSTTSACAGSTFTYYNPTSGLGASSGGTVTVSPIFSQGLTHTGPETISGQLTTSNNNGIFWAGPGPTPTIDQAKTACGALPGCIVNISPGYTGPEATSCVANSTGYFTDQSAANVIIHDYRALLPLSRCYYGFILGGRSFGAFTKLGSTGYWTGVLTDSTVAQSNINFVDNATLPTNGGAMNGSVNVVLSSGSNTVGTSNAPWVGSDGECDIQATTFDFPVNNCYGANGQTNIVRTNGAQSIINAVGQHAAVNSNVSSAGAQMINSYGTLNELQSAGVGRNYSEYNRGNVLFDTETQTHSLITGANVTITAATESTQIVTITTSGVCTFTTNQEVSITGVTPAAYNGRYFVRSPGCNGGSTFTYFHPTSASLGAGTVFGIVNGLTPQTTTYFRNSNIIQHNPLSDTQGWQWQTIGGSLAFRIIPASLITSFLPHEFTGRAIFDEAAAPGGSATQDLFWGDSTTHTPSWNNNNNGVSSPTGAWQCTNVTPVTVNANVTTDQNLMACTIPAGTLNRVGRSLQINIAGVYSTVAASTASLTYKVKLCTVSGCGSGTVITLASISTGTTGALTAASFPFNLTLQSTTQTAGASSAYEAHGRLVIDITSALAADSVFADSNTATIGTIDDTAQLFLQTTAASATASTSNSWTQRQLVVQTVN